MPNRMKIDYRHVEMGVGVFKERPETVDSDAMLETLLASYLSVIPDYDIEFYCTTGRQPATYNCGVCIDGNVLGTVTIMEDCIEFYMMKNVHLSDENLKELSGLPSEDLFHKGSISHSDPNCFDRFKKDIMWMLEQALRVKS